MELGRGRDRFMIDNREGKMMKCRRRVKRLFLVQRGEGH